MTLPFLLKIFQSQIEYVFLITHGTIDITNTNKIWKLPYGLYELWFNQENDLIVFFVSSTLFILMIFIFFYPYSLMYNNKTSQYYKIIKLYEERFIQE
jgi:cellobiose-specific phosphotransferase system component IIC